MLQKLNVIRGLLAAGWMLASAGSVSGALHIADFEEIDTAGKFGFFVGAPYDEDGVRIESSTPTVLFVNGDQQPAWPGSAAIAPSVTDSLDITP